MWYRSLFRSKRWAAWPALLLLLAGCAGVGPTGRGAPLISPLPALLTEEVVLYFPHQSLPVLVQERRTVVRKGEQPELLVLQELTKGPTSPDARPIVDLDADAVVMSFRGAKVFDGSVSLIVGQTVAEALRRSGEIGVYAVVNSLASIERVKTVYFMIQGLTDPFLVDGIDITEQLSPRWDLVSAPPEPQTCRTAAPAVTNFPYLGEIQGFGVSVVGTADEVALTDDWAVAWLRGALAGAAVTTQTPPEPDVELHLHTGRPDQPKSVRWLMGTALFQVVVGDHTVVLKAVDACVAPVTQAVKAALGGD